MVSLRTTPPGMRNDGPNHTASNGRRWSRAYSLVATAVRDHRTRVLIFGQSSAGDLITTWQATRLTKLSRRQTACPRYAREAAPWLMTQTTPVTDVEPGLPWFTPCQRADLSWPGSTALGLLAAAAALVQLVLN